MIYLATADAGLPQGSEAWTLSATQARTGSKSFFKNGAQSSFRIVGTFPLISPSTIYMRFATYCSSTSLCAFWGRFNILGPNFGVASNTGTSLTVRNDATTVATIPLMRESYIWQLWEMKATTTTIEVRLDGETIYSGTGLTVNLTDLQQIYISGWFSSQAFSGFIDDIMVTDQGWPGSGGVYALTPSGAGTHQDWTGSLPTLTTDAAVLATKHTYVKAPLPAGALNVTGAGVFAVTKATGQGDAGVATILGANSGPKKFQNVSTRAVEQFWDGPWTPAEFNALEFGVASA